MAKISGIPPGSPSQPENHQDKDASLDSQMKAIWDAEMETPRTKPVLYREVHVLLLSWDDNVDDLKTGKEVKQLQTLFEATFKFQTTWKILHRMERPTAQAQANKHLANFVADHEDQSTLLIVYYAGHGRPGDSKNGLTLAARQDINPKPDAELSEIIWSSTEHIIKATRSDVLVIFDCCYAGALEKNHRSIPHRRAYEYLAATSADSETYKPGPKSFTTALIWSMEHLAMTEGNFTTQHLLSTIIKDAPNFPQNQYPRLSDGVAFCQRKITLTPLNKGNVVEVSPIETQEERWGPAIDLSLRFTFNESSLNTDLISKLAKKVSKCLSRDEFKGSMVNWEGLNTRCNEHSAASVAHRWLSLTQHKRRISTGVPTRNSFDSSLVERSLSMPGLGGMNSLNTPNLYDFKGSREAGNLPTPGWEHASSSDFSEEGHKRPASDMDEDTPVSCTSSNEGLSKTPIIRARPHKRKRLSQP
ncbi:hypothetical protein HYFRA_00004415 [Hymenoscyphus fraxineus]|uniref:Peptidase C14 caspase domain-containing protein n=1 Tax=Hymenoscyphus fraxineus TaxID=746836 RepID=A0A9N9PUG2_9HELO|nr:hypothetical protein HYFRA_00004415 [Hymenoscyphus fraxineus]